MGKRIRVIGIVAAVLVLALLSLPFLVDANQFRPALESRLTKALGREVKLGDLKLSVFSGGVTAGDLSVADDSSFSHDPFLRAKSLKLGVELWPLVFSRKLHVTGLTIDQPEIVLLRASSGTWNFSSLGAKPSTKPETEPVPAPQSALDLSVKLVKISDGRVSIGKVHSQSKPRVFDKVNAQLRNFSASSVFPFSVSTSVAGNGEIKLDGKAGPIDASDVAMTPLDASLNVAHLDLAASRFADASSGVSGLVAVDGHCTSNGHKLAVTGRIKAEQLKLAKNGSPAGRPVGFDFTLDYDLAKHSGALARGDIHIGSATATLTGTYSMQAEATVLHLNLSGRDMPVPELAAMLPALGVVLPSGSSLQGGTASANFVIEGPADKLVTTGSLGLANTRLAGFDLGTNISMVAQLAGVKAGRDTDIRTFSANLRVDPEGVQARDVTLIAPTIGELAGAGTVSAAHALDFKMRVMLHASAGIMGAFGQKGDTSVPFLIRGTASSPAFEPDVEGIASQGVKSLMKGNDSGKAASGLFDSIFGKKKKQ